MLEQRLDDGLNGRPPVCVDGHVKPSALFRGEGHADKRSFHCVEPRRLGVKGKAACVGEFGDQGLERCLVRHHDVLHASVVQRSQCRDGWGDVHGGIEHAQLSVAVGGRSWGGCHRRHRRLGSRGSGPLPEDASRERSEFKFLQDRSQHFCIRAFHGHGREVFLEVDVDHDGCQFAAQEGELFVGFDLFLHFAIQLVDIFIKPFHGSVCLKELDGGFFADPRNPRNVVGGIAHQAQQIDDLLRLFQTVAFAHFVRTPNGGWVATSPGTEHANLVRDELCKILVRGHHEHVEPFFFCALGEAPYQVVSLKSWSLQHGNLQAFEDADDPWDAQLDVFRRFVSVGFVVRELLVAQGGTGRVKHHRDVGRLFCADDLQKGVGESKHRRRIHPLGVDAWIFDEGVIRPKNQGIGIDEKELFVGMR